MKSKEEVLEILKGEKDKKRIVEFAWRCAVRALPYLGKGGNFNYWREEERQKNLYFVFKALDIANSFVLSSTKFSYTEASRIAFLLKGIAEDKPLFLKGIDEINFYEHDASVASSVVASISSSVSASSFQSSTESCIVATVVAYISSSEVFKDTNDDLNALLDNDLYAIKEKIQFAPLNGTSVYGEVWNNFQKALIEVGCDFWAELYKDVLTGIFDIDRLYQRLDIYENKNRTEANDIASFLTMTEAFREERGEYNFLENDKDELNLHRKDELSQTYKLEKELKEKIIAAEKALMEIEVIKASTKKKADEFAEETKTHKNRIGDDYKEIDIKAKDLKETLDEIKNANDKATKSLLELSRGNEDVAKNLLARKYHEEANIAKRYYEDFLLGGFIALGCAISVVCYEIWRLFSCPDTKTPCNPIELIAEHPFLLFPIVSLTLLFVGVSIVLFRESARHYRRYVFYNDISIKILTLREHLHTSLGISKEGELKPEHMEFGKSLMKVYLSTIYKDDDTKDVDVQQLLAIMKNSGDGKS